MSGGIRAMDETSLRRLLERALVNEPSIGPVARNSLRAGLKLRRRRRAWGVDGSTAAVAAITASIPVVSGRSAIFPPRRALRHRIGRAGRPFTSTPVQTQ